MPTSTSGRDSRRSSTKSGASGREAQKSSSDRRAKAQSQQSYDGRRRPSQQAESGLRIASESLNAKGRTNSAPLVHTLAASGRRDASEAGSQKGKNDGKDARVVNEVDGAQDEDEVAGVVGAVKHFQPFQTPELAEPLPDINIAIIGAEGVGKSTFMQKALGLPFLSDSHAVERKIGIEGNDYLLRLLELPIDDVDIDDDDTISWPETIEDKLLPKIDGALTLYDVKDESSLENVPEMLNAIKKTGIPSLLVSCKCDATVDERDVDPRTIEMKAKRQIKDIETLQVSVGAPESHKQGITMILRAILNNPPEEQKRSSSANRRRAQSNAIRPVSPRMPNERGHHRATSEYTGSLFKDQRHTRHDSSLTGQHNSHRLKVPSEEDSQEEMHGSFLLEESASEASMESRQSYEETLSQPLPGMQSSATSLEEGTTFEELVDRLLAQPMSKADGKFVAVFLALYRKFAPPGQLLEAIVERFDMLERNNSTHMTKTINQLRYLCVLEQWISTYPGDFTFPKTKRRVRTFVGKLSLNRMFAAAGKEMSAHLDYARDDDDTNWAYCDRDRASTGGDARSSLSSTASILLDDPNFSLSDTLTLTPPSLPEGSNFAISAGGDIVQSASSSSLSSHLMLSVEAAQRQAELLRPIPRQPVTKVQWRLLMDFPDDVIAKELTRIDWIMFCSIRPRDLVRQVSLTGEQKADCKNLAHVNRMIEHFNQLASWVENYVLLRDKPKHRALMLEKLMRIARKLRELNNYNALGAIIAGVKSTAVHRLAATRELIAPSLGKDWMKMEILMAPSRSYAAYRLAWENSNAERIPYLPLHRRDLVSAEEGNKTFIGDEKDVKINWRKFEIMGEVIVGMQRAQGVPYKSLGPGRGNEQVKELVLDVRLVKDEDELFARSKQVEPTGTTAVSTSTKVKEFFKR